MYSEGCEEMNKYQNKLSRVLYLARVELILAYRVPLLEGLLAIVVAVSGLSFSMIVYQDIGMNLPLHPSPFYNGAEAVQNYLDLLSSRAMFVFFLAQSTCLFVLSIFVPLFFAFTFGKSFEDGSLRNLLSYPISRNRFALVKVGMSMILWYLPLVCIPLLLIGLTFPSGVFPPFLSFAAFSTLLSVALLVTISFLLVVLLKSSSAAAIVGILLGIGMAALSFLPDLPFFPLILLNPSKAITNYVLDLYPDISVLTFIVGIGMVCSILISTIIIGLVVFRRSDL
jgi:ABC-type transport system involved in multi-copper enzyme maturation permease subunit